MEKSSVIVEFMTFRTMMKKVGVVEWMGRWQRMQKKKQQIIKRS